LSFIDEVVFGNSDIASSYIAGTTHENRQLKVIKIKAPTASTSKAVWIGEFNKINSDLKKGKIYFNQFYRLWHSCGE